MIPSGSISVVGNSQSLFGKGYGSQIDQHTTIRFNHIPSLDPVHQGIRWDYMATSNPREIMKWNKHAGELPFKNFFFTPWAESEEKHHSKRRWQTPMYTTPREVWKEVQQVTKARPSTGILVLYTLHKLGLKDVHIFGFDWKATPTYYNDPVKEMGESKMHDYVDERKICMELISKNNWKYHA